MAEDEAPYSYVEVTVQLGNREAVTFRREFGFDADPLEKLGHLVDAIKDYLESD